MAAKQELPLQRSSSPPQPPCCAVARSAVVSLQKSRQAVMQGKANDGRTIQKILFHFEHFSEPWRAGPPLLRHRRRRRRQRKSRRSVATPFRGTASARGGYGLSHPRRGMAITNTMVCQHKVPMTRNQEPVLVTRYRCSMGWKRRRCTFQSYPTWPISVPRRPNLAVLRTGELTLKGKSTCCVPVPSSAELTASSHGRKLLMPGIEDSEAYAKRRDGLANANMHERLGKAAHKTPLDSRQPWATVTRGTSMVGRHFSRPVDISESRHVM